VHAPTTVPQFDFVSGPSGEVDIKVGLEGQWLDTVYLAIVRLRDHLNLDVLEATPYLSMIARQLHRLMALLRGKAPTSVMIIISFRLLFSA